MDIRSALKGQYHASLKMLRNALEACPESLWNSGNPPRQFWRLAYHTLFFTDMYLQDTEGDFVPWEKHRSEVEGDETTEIMEPAPYQKEDLIAYCDIVDAKVDARIDAMDLSALECGIPWYSMPKLDHQILNIRHIQEHAGQLRDRLLESGVDQRWVGRA